MYKARVENRYALHLDAPPGDTGCLLLSAGGRSGLFQHLLLLFCICGRLLPPCGYVQLLQLCISGIALTPSGYVWSLQLCSPGPL